MRNFALDRSKNETHDTKNMLCAKKTENAAKLDVGICYLPIIRGWTTGPYWIVSYDEGLGYALVIGGQPTIKTENGCKTG